MTRLHGCLPVMGTPRSSYRRDLPAILSLPGTRHECHFNQLLEDLAQDFPPVVSPSTTFFRYLVQHAQNTSNAPDN